MRKAVFVFALLMSVRTHALPVEISAETAECRTTASTFMVTEGENIYLQWDYTNVSDLQVQKNAFHKWCGNKLDKAKSGGCYTGNIVVNSEAEEGDPYAIVAQQIPGCADKIIWMDVGPGTGN